jgi:hypothetical protein
VTINKITVISCFDVIGAFLKTPIKPGIRMFMRVNSDIAAHWIIHYPERADYLDDDKKIYFELKSYAYDLRESSHEFNDILVKDLKRIGMQQNADPCPYMMKTDDGILILSAHVDDLLLTTPNGDEGNGLNRK